MTQIELIAAGIQAKKQKALDELKQIEADEAKVAEVLNALAVRYVSAPAGAGPRVATPTEKPPIEKPPVEEPKVDPPAVPEPEVLEGLGDAEQERPEVLNGAGMKPTVKPEARLGTRIKERIAAAGAASSYSAGRPPAPAPAPAPTSLFKTKDVTNHSYGQKVEDVLFIAAGADFVSAKPPITFKFPNTPRARQRYQRGTDRTVYVKDCADRLHLAPTIVVYFLTLFSRMAKYNIAVVELDDTTGYFELTDRAARALRAGQDHIQALAALYRGIFVEPSVFPRIIKGVEEARDLAAKTEINIRGVRKAQEKLGVAGLSVSEQVGVPPANGNGIGGICSTIEKLT